MEASEAKLLFPLPSVQEVASLSISSFAYELPAHQLLLYHKYVCAFLKAACEKLDLNIATDQDNIASPSKLPSADEQQTSSSISNKPRSYTALPTSSEENRLGAWTLKCSIGARALNEEDADLSIGCDQGGSCRIPGAMCGVVGCKPTHGLVPYTYIDGMYGPIDHAGPITRTVEDNALLLGVLAGWDGLDERASSTARSVKKVNYCERLKQGVKGMRIGVVKEGLMVPYMEEDVKKATEDSAQVLREMGAVVEAVSIPLHFTSIGIWRLSVLPSVVQRLFYSRERDPLSGVDKQGKVYDRLTFMREHLLAHVASWSFQFRISVLAGEWLRVHFPESLKVAEAYKRPLIESYATALSQVDVLLFPTTACKTKKLPKHLSTPDEYEHASAELLAKHVDMGSGLAINTVCFNVTGHPALSVPVGGGRAASKGGESSDGVALPIGVMLVGDFFQEATLYQVAYALEQARPWQSFLYCGGSPLATDHVPTN